MKRLLPVLALLASASFVVAAKPKSASAPAPASEAPLSQSEAGLRLIYSVLAGKPDSVALYLQDSLRGEATPEAVEGLRSQMAWLYGLIGGEFHEFNRGTRVFDDSSRAYYREYQMANATNQRAPILVAQVLFPDSVTPQSVGFQVKSFLGNEKHLTGEKVWNIGGRDIEIHSMVLADGGQGPILAILIYDPDTAALDRQRIGRVATPVIREAIARGYLDSAKAANGGVALSDQVGAVFLRHDPNLGFIHARIAFRPEEYRLGGLDSSGNPVNAPQEAKPEASPPKPKGKAKKK